MGSTHEALEHAEHVQHAAHDPFDKRVAMTMAVVAAALASVTLLSHREHNETILQQSQAATLHTQASDMWNFYQAKNIRTHEYNAFAALLNSLGKDSVQEDKAKKALAYWEKKAKVYEDTDLPKLKKDAEDIVKKAKEHEEHSHASHIRAYAFDGGELFIEMALVLCSIAVLTKMRSFWFVGIGSCVFGVAVAMLPFCPFWGSILLTFGMGHHGGDHHDGDHGAPAQHAPQTPGKGGGEHKPAH